MPQDDPTKPALTYEAGEPRDPVATAKGCLVPLATILVAIFLLGLIIRMWLWAVHP